MHDVISLFTGIGGMDMGFGGRVVVHKESIATTSLIERRHDIEDFVELKPTNYRIVLQNDIMEGAKEVCQFNKTDHNYIVKSIRDVLDDASFEFPRADVVIGGFPCQTFSIAGKREGFNSDRGTLYKCFVEVVDRVKPKVFVAENVRGLLTIPGAIDQVVSDFKELGYDVQYELIDCTEFGIPQTRKRVIIMGARNDVKLPEHWNIIDTNKTMCAVKHYFKHLAEPHEIDDTAHKSYSLAKKLLKGQGQNQINEEGFAPTMRAEHHGNIEFRHTDRRLSVREAGLIQTFPPDFIFNKKKNLRAYKYIGNAVPPLLAYLIAHKVSHILQFFRPLE